MKKLVLVAVFLLGFSVVAMAQDAPAVEVFGGYSLVLVDTATASGSEVGDMDLHLDGWNASVAFNGNKWLGFLADFGGYYGTLGEDLSTTTGDETAAVHVHSIMFGPKFTLHRGKVAPYIHALFGYGRLSSTVKDYTDVEHPEGVKVTVTENDFAMAFGGGLDVNLSPKVAIRPVQVDYFTTKTGLTGDFADHFRYSAGIVFKFGNR